MQLDLYLGHYAIAAYAAQAHDVAMLCLAGDGGSRNLNYDPETMYGADAQQTLALDQLRTLDAETLARVLRKHAESLRTQTSRFEGVRAHLPGMWSAFLDLHSPPAGAEAARVTQAQLAERFAGAQTGLRGQPPESVAAAMRRHALAEAAAKVPGPDGACAGALAKQAGAAGNAAPAGPYNVPARARDRGVKSSRSAARKRKPSDSSLRSRDAAAGPSPPSASCAARTVELSDVGSGAPGAFFPDPKATAPSVHGPSKPLQSECAAARALIAVKACLSVKLTVLYLAADLCCAALAAHAACCNASQQAATCRAVRRTRSQSQAEVRVGEEAKAKVAIAGFFATSLKHGMDAVTNDPKRFAETVQYEGVLRALAA